MTDAERTRMLFEAAVALAAAESQHTALKGINRMDLALFAEGLLEAVEFVVESDSAPDVPAKLAA